MNETTSAASIDRIRTMALIVGVAGAVICGVAAMVNTQQLLASYLVGYLFWWSMTLGCLGLLMLHNLVAGGWGSGVREYWRAALPTLPLLAVLFAPIALSLNWIYSWATEHGAHLTREKLQYLNAPFFWSRAVFYFVVWLILAWMMGSRRWIFVRHVTPALRGWSAFGLVLMVLTVTFASIDWVMSLEPHWHSTIFGGLFLADAALAALLLSILCGSRWGIAADSHYDDGLQCLHDLGNLLLGFVMIWTYFAFSQYLIIWSGNLPEEIPWYLRRISGGWRWLAVAIALTHFVIPLSLLFSREVKRNSLALVRVSLLLLAARLADLFWTVQPSFSTSGLTVYWALPAAVAAVGGLWIAVFCTALRRARVRGNTALLFVGRPDTTSPMGHVEETL